MQLLRDLEQIKMELQNTVRAEAEEQMEGLRNQLEDQSADIAEPERAPAR